MDLLNSSNNVINKVTKDGKYTIYSDGKIYSNTCKRFMKPKIDKDGYLEIKLNEISYRVHQIILRTFVGDPPKDMLDPTVDHIDGNRQNNNISNLRWLERGINSSLAKNKGIGEKNHEAILTEKQVKEICELLLNGNELEKIAKIYNVHKSTISNIKRKKTWSHITKDYNFKLKSIKNKEESKIQRKEIYELLISGKSVKEIHSLGYPNTVIYRVKNKIKIS